jgi:hypothetical protein
MIQQHLPSIRSSPAIQIPLLVFLTAEPSPCHPEADAELTGELRPYGGMAKGVGRIQDVASSPETGSVGLTHQQISDQRLPRRYELIGQHIPWPDLKLSRAHQLGDFRLPVRTYPQIILQQNGLAVQEKSDVSLSSESVEKIIQRGD